MEELEQLFLEDNGDTKKSDTKSILSKVEVTSALSKATTSITAIYSNDSMLHDLKSKYANSFNRVDEHIFISGYLIAADNNFIRTNGIKFILKMFVDSPEYYGGAHRHPGVEYMIVPAIDHPEYDISAAIPMTIAFIAKAKAMGQKILIHCHMGISRSATVILSFLMAFHGMPLDTALTFLKSKRSIVNPNTGFLKYLKKIESNSLITDRFLVLN